MMLELDAVAIIHQGWGFEQRFLVWLKKQVSPLRSLALRVGRNDRAWVGEPTSRKRGEKWGTHFDLSITGPLDAIRELPDALGMLWRL
jgi:hypothetical protein